MKYGNVRTGGFSSKLEAAVYDRLCLLERAGDISEIQIQDHVYLTDARILYVPDFKIKTLKGDIEWVEAKGFETDVWRIKRRLWIHYGPGKLTIYKSGGRLGPVIFEELKPKVKLVIPG